MKVTILRGLPGSGKSTWAQANEMTHAARTCSADFYFDGNSGYVFDASKIGQAHAECQSEFSDYVLRRKPHVVVDNTNVTNREMEFYVKLALAHGYEVEIREFNGGYKSIHDVPESTMERMRKRWEPVKPEWEKYLVKG